VIGLRLALAGLLFRRSTALIVLVLATVASAAAVVAPLYSRAAEESILRDTLARTDPFSLAVQLSVPSAGTGAGRGAARNGNVLAAAAKEVLAHPAFGEPRVSYVGSGRYAPTAGPFRGDAVAGSVVERTGLCENVTLTSGRCPTAAGEGLVTNRSLALIGGQVGRDVVLGLENTATLADQAATPALPVRIVGTIDPVPVSSPYWAGRPYFASYYPQESPLGLGEVPPTADPVFVGPGTASRAGITRYTVDIPLVPNRVRLDDVPVLRRQLSSVYDVSRAAALTPDSQLPAALAVADEGRQLVRVASPLAVTQLVLLSWWALFLVVGSATEERSPELGLAKLRGLNGRQTSRFGLAEVLLLLLIAAPVGTVLGYLAVRAAASRVFASGTSVVLAWPVLVTVVGALAGGLVIAVLSSRQVLRRPIAELLRRVPPRSAGRRAGVVEGVVLVLTVVGVVQLAAERGGRPSPVALLAPGMVAVAGGLLAGRLLVRVARARAVGALDRGRAAAAAGWAGVARRPGTARIASVLAVATCLLLVGVESWTVAERNRVQRSAAETGAEVVLHVRAPDAAALLATVRAADPAGRYAMAAVQVDASNQEPSLLAVDAPRADGVLLWGAAGPDDVSSVLRPELPDPVLLHRGALTVTIDVRALSTPSPLALSARLDDGSRLDLGALRPGRHDYTGQVPHDARLVAFGLSHSAQDIEAATAELRLERVAQDRTDLAGDFAIPGAWRAGTQTVGGPQVQLELGSTLGVRLRASGGPVAEVVRGDSPEPLPSLVGKDAQPDDGAGTTTGLAGRPLRYRADKATDYLPRLGGRAVLVDLELALRLTDAPVQGDPQVWLSRDDRAAEQALRRRLDGAGLAVQERESRADLERGFAGNGAVLALRLLLVSGGTAVLVAVGALLVAAYIGRRQRAYEVAALRVVGLRSGTVRALLLRENVGTVLVALLSGAVAAAVAVAVVLPALPQFDQPSEYVPARYAPDLPAALLSLGALGLLLLAVGLVVAALQLRSGRPDRLREGVR
jgi:putative ABC transport system permease protein